MLKPKWTLSSEEDSEESMLKKITFKKNMLKKNYNRIYTCGVYLWRKEERREGSLSHYDILCYIPLY